MSEEQSCTPERMIEGFENLSEQDKVKVQVHVLGTMFEGCEMPTGFREMMEKCFKPGDVKNCDAGSRDM